MATTTGPDLTGARAAYTRIMDDTCVVLRDTADTSGSGHVLDEATGEVLPRTAGSAGVDTVYDGPCVIDAPGQTQPREGGYGGAQTDERFCDISLPWDTPGATGPILPGDTLTCTSSRRDTQLVGNVYIIRRVAQETFLISRDLVGELL